MMAFRLFGFSLSKANRQTVPSWKGKKKNAARRVSKAEVRLQAKTKSKSNESLDNQSKFIWDFFLRSYPQTMFIEKFPF